MVSTTLCKEWPQVRDNSCSKTQSEEESDSYKERQRDEICMKTFVFIKRPNYSETLFISIKIIIE